MQALYQPTLLLLGSPNIDAFSLRPTDLQPTVSLLSALNAQDAPIPKTRSTPDARGTGSRITWATLESEGLSRDMLMLLDLHFLAQALILFHRSVLEGVPEDVDAGFVLGGKGEAEEGKELFRMSKSPNWLLDEAWVLAGPPAQIQRCVSELTPLHLPLVHIRHIRDRVLVRAAAAHDCVGGDTEYAHGDISAWVEGC
ncbi:hypothetical protein DXG01_015871 [Tephrocybe rancida]|nr:hypothetical protein DXG01_015871 [Tephrocybe rancida]